MNGLRIEARLGGTPRTIVRALELEVGAGETVGIVGESGSGKSLTARALIGLLPGGVHARGEIAFGGQNLLGLSERSLRRIRGRKIALLLQDPYTMLNPLLRIGTQIMETAPKRSRPRRADPTPRRGRDPRPAGGRAVSVPALGRHAAARRDRGRPRQ